MRVRKVLLVIGMAWIAGKSVSACPVCFGAAEAPVLDGMNMSILFMLILTYCLIAGLAVFFVVLRRRQRQFEIATSGNRASRIGSGALREFGTSVKAASSDSSAS